MKRTVWIDAELIGQHVHATLSTGKQYGQDALPTYDRRQNYRNDAGEAGKLILREDQWPSFIKALAVGGHATGLRVIWRLDRTKSDHVHRVMDEHGDWLAVRDCRFLWNASREAPAIIGTVEPVPWDVTSEPITEAAS